MQRTSLYLADEIRPYFSEETPLFDQIMDLRGECFRKQKGRITQRILLGEHYYFIKQFFGVGWKEIIKDLSQFRMPVLGAKNEYVAINKLQSLGLAVPTVVGYGQRGFNPARIHSFIIMREIYPFTSLEMLMNAWQQTPPSFKLKQHMIDRVAGIARILHKNGINHRDFYLCHFVLDSQLHNTQLYLIDFHRAQIRRKTPDRWMIKDLAGLYFSSKAMRLTQRDHYRFLIHYRRNDLRSILSIERNFWQKVKMRGEQLYHKHYN